MLLYHLGSHHSHSCHRHLNAERMIAITHTATDRIAQRIRTRKFTSVYGVGYARNGKSKAAIVISSRKSVVKQHNLPRSSTLAKSTHAGSDITTAAPSDAILR